VIEPLKLYFDACCSTRLAVDLLAFYSPDYPTLQTRHLFQDERPDTADPAWIEKLKGKGWIIVSCDRGRDRKTFPLPLACAQAKITHVLFSPTIQNKGPTAQKNALAAVWPSLFRLDEYPPGTQMRLGENGRTRAGVIRYSIAPYLPRPKSG
jgi:hypothetical protein